MQNAIAWSNGAKSSSNGQFRKTDLSKGGFSVIPLVDKDHCRKSFSLEYDHLDREYKALFFDFVRFEWPPRSLLAGLHVYLMLWVILLS